MPSKLQEKGGQSWPVGLFRLPSSNMSRLSIIMFGENNSRVSSIQDKPEGKEEVQKELEEGLEILIQNNIDLIIVEVGRTFTKHVVMRH